MRFHTLATSACLALAGCAHNPRPISLNLNNYEPEKPFVVGSNGLATKSLEHIVQKHVQIDNLPYVVTDTGQWTDTLEAISEAHRQNRDIILIGSSAGCHDAWLVAKHCEKQGVEISRMVYINPFYTLFTAPQIPPNVEKFNVYFSNGLGFMDWANGFAFKFIGLDNGHTRFAEPQFINATHSDYIDEPTLNKDLRVFLSTKVANAHISPITTQ